MYLKLSFTTAKPIRDILRMVVAITNNQAITSVGSLTSNYSTWNSTITQYFDAANSEIVRSNTASTVKAHFARNNTSSDADAIQGHCATFEFPVYDDASGNTKFYVQFNNNADAGNGYVTHNSYVYVGTGITGGTMTSSQLALTATPNVTTNTGTLLSLVGGYGNVYMASMTSTIKTFFARITSSGIVFALSNQNGGTDWPSTFGNSSIMNGPWIISQYTRYDYHNNNGNGMIPVFYSNVDAGEGNGFGYGDATTADWDTVSNVTYTGTNANPFKVHSIVDARPSTNSTWAKIYNQPVNWGTGSRLNYATAPTASSALTTAGGLTYGTSLTKTANYRYPTANLTGTSFAFLPLTWGCSYYNNHGGNVTDRSEIFIFNGDYYPGDELTYNGVTYTLWPTWRGFSNRIGIAVPKT